MFTEELAGNANRKRQEQARERRRKLKQQQQRKRKEHNGNSNDNDNDKGKSNQLQATTTSTRTNAVTDLCSTEPTSTGNRLDDQLQPSAIKTKNTLGSSSSDVVAKALEQRRIRSLQKRYDSSSLTIQAAFRAYLSNKKLMQKERTILTKRLSDLSTLGDILKKQNKSKSDYVPPTSLAIALVHQLLFLTHSTPRTTKLQKKDCDHFDYVYFSKVADITTEDVQLLTKVTENVLLPGILSNDSHLDPTVVWLESKEGRVKFKKLLRLVCFVLRARVTHKGKTHGNMPLVCADEIRAIDRFLRILLGVDVDSSTESGSLSANKDVVQFCRNVLLVQRSDDLVLQPGGVIIGQNPVQIENLDLIYQLRSFLLYPSSRKDAKVIPSNAEEMRENCINKNDRDRGNMIFCLTLRAVITSSSSQLKKRFFAQVMTVPLLTWRVESASLTSFVQHDPSLQKGNGEGARNVPMLHLLEVFADSFALEITNGSSESFLNTLPQSDIPLTICPSPSVLSLFANMVQIGYTCPFVNGRAQLFDFDAAASYFNFMALLSDLIPVTTFSSRQSSVEWISDGSHLTPIVLSPVILDQCKLILLDSYVRMLFNCAIDVDALNVDAILSRKDSRDKKLEKDLQEIMTESSASVAAREAMVDRTKGFWQRSKWAKKLHSVFSSSNEKSHASKSKKATGGKLMNTTSMSRKLASGSAVIDSKEEKLEEKRKADFNIAFFYAICRTYAIILSRWGGAGGNDIVKRIAPDSVSDSKQIIATSKPEPCVLSLLNVVCFSTPFVKTAWSLIQSDSMLSNELQSMTDSSKRAKPIRSSSVTPVLNKSIKTGDTGQAILLMLVVSLSHTLIVTDDIELHEMGRPLPLHQIRRCILLLKNLLYRACCLDDTLSSNSASFPSNHFGLSLICSSSKLMRDLHDRSSRRALCVPKLWLFETLLEDDIRRSKTYEDYCTILNSPVLRVCPFLVSFKRRLKLFEKIVTSNRDLIQGRNDGFSPRPGVHINIMRGRVLEDGLIHLNKLGRKLRQRIIVQYLNQAGARETGLDAGGLFKEFWSDLSELSFNPNYALFSQTESGLMYPNPSSRAAHGSDSIILFEFLGRILGKALYENISIKPQFAHFFLSFLRGDYNFLHMLPDLSTLDQILYNNLMFLKTYDGDAEDLCLTFTVADEDFGTNREIELIPNGSNIDVTDLNKHRYIGLVAKHHVCDRVREQSEAFTRGLWDVIDRSWLRIFNEPELQVLISGPSDGQIDVEDMKANSRYTGGYTGLDRQIHRFWKIVASFDKKQQADLLRFVTSCERPPPLGFGSLNPPFTIQRVAIMMDSDKLPTASTCFNILKLPTYSSEKVMRERLLYSIQSGAGFELT